jgi:hypothetical protein
MHWILSEEPAEVQPSVPLVEDLLLSQAYTDAEHPVSWLRRALNLTPEQIEDAAKQTCGQRDNPLWAAIRKKID